MKKARAAVALKDAGFSNREIARALELNESTIRRGLNGYKERPAEQKFEITVRPI